MRQPNERQGVTIAVFALAVLMIGMAGFNPKLWEVEVFKVLIQAVVLTGILNMVVAFHFAANKSDETKASNTGKAFDAITATAKSNTADTVDISAQTVNVDNPDV